MPKNNPALAEAAPFADPAVPGLEPTPPLHGLLSLLDQAPTPPLGVLSSVASPVEAASAAAFINVEQIPEISAQRQTARQTAVRVIERNSHLLHTGRATEVPRPVNALGTVREVVAIKRQHGIDSPQYRKVFPGLVLDNERLTGEMKSKNRSEYFARARRIFHSATEGYFSHGLPITNMTRNGLSPLAEAVEGLPRRVNELVEEEGTYVPIGNMIARMGLKQMVETLPITVSPEVPNVSLQVTTASMCTDDAERRYEINAKDSFEGLRPGMKGIAIRRAHFEDDSGDREDEMVIISGIYITLDLIQAVIAEKGGLDLDQKLTKTELQGSQFMSVNDGSVVEFVRELDEKAGARHGKKLFFGEEVSDDHSRDYYQFIEEAEDRRVRLAPLPTQLAEFQIDLEERGVDSELAEAMINKFLKDKMLALAKRNPKLAEVMFDKETADGFREVARLESIGQIHDARRLELITKKNAPEVSYCGSGGCAELDSINPLSAEGQLALSLGLRGRMVRNKVAACKNCKEKQLYHDYNGNTVCVACKSTKLSGQEAKHTPKVVVPFRQTDKPNKPSPSSA